MESNKQEKSNLLKDNPVAKVASGGSWMSKHISSSLGMGKAHSMAPKMESPVELTKGGKEKIMNSDANPAFKAAIAKETPAEMKSDGPLYMHDDPPTPHALGNKKASTGTDGKKTIISSKMQKNYKPLKEKKPMGKIKTITKRKK